MVIITLECNYKCPLIKPCHPLAARNTPNAPSRWRYKCAEQANLPWKHAAPPMGAIVAMTGPPAAGALGWVIITRAVIASVPDHPSVTPRLGGSPRYYPVSPRYYPVSPRYYPGNPQTRRDSPRSPPGYLDEPVSLQLLATRLS